MTKMTQLATSRHPIRTVAFANLKEMTSNILGIYFDGEIPRILKKAAQKHKDLIEKPMDFRKHLLATAVHAIEVKTVEFRHSLYPRILRLAGISELETAQEESVKTDLSFELDGVSYLIDCKKQDKYGLQSRADIIRELISKKTIANSTLAYMWFCNASMQNGKAHYASALANTQGAYVCYGNELFRLLNIHCSNGQKISEVVDDVILEYKINEQLKSELNLMLGKTSNL
jgi:hypothetical protein